MLGLCAICEVEIASYDFLTVFELQRFKIHLYFTPKITAFPLITFEPHIPTCTTYIQNVAHTMLFDRNVRKQN